MSVAVEQPIGSRQDGPSFEARVSQLRDESRGRRPIPFAERVAALDQLADALVRGRAELPPSMRTSGAAFLAAFLRASHLEHLVRREIADPASLDRFVPVGERKSLRIVPRGIVCHWIAGNVPLLGMYSWALSALAGNVNVVRLSSRQDDLMSPVLDRLRAVSAAGARLADDTLVTTFDRDDRTAHEAMSRAADVRIAWGGQDAVEAVRSLPCRWECEDILMGPRVSLAVVDPAVLDDGALSRLAADIVYFDQSACSSPQVVFARLDPHAAEFEPFVERFARSLDEQTRRFGRHRLDFGETYRIQLDRARVLLEGGSLRHDAATRWTLAIVDRPIDAVRCTNAFVQLVPFEDFETVYRDIPANVQTAVMALPPADAATFAERAAQLGVCRLPAPGTGNHFENPWDGMGLMSRLTRWVVKTDPAGGATR
jgi:hypothetical protein